jgi:hypothetical protein
VRLPDDALANLLPNVFVGTNSTLSNIARQLRMPDIGRMKRTVQVNVKMTQDDFELLQKAAKKRWTDAVLTNSGIVLALAKIAARQTLAKKKT